MWDTALSDQGTHSPYIRHGVYYLEDRWGRSAKSTIPSCAQSCVVFTTWKIGGSGQQCLPYLLVRKAACHDLLAVSPAPITARLAFDGWQADKLDVGPDRHVILAEKRHGNLLGGHRGAHVRVGARVQDVDALVVLRLQASSTSCSLSDQA